MLKHSQLVLAAAVASAILETQSLAATLTGDTSIPDYSVTSIGQPVQLNFSATGLTPNQQSKLNLTYQDEHGNVLSSQSISVSANASGNWQSAPITALANHLGYYRVNASLSDGTQLSGLGSRPAGYLTYAVVPDPAKRVDYGENNFFGLQGGFGSNWQEAGQKYLGVRWVLDGNYGWRNNEPNYAGQWNGSVPQGPSQSWKTYALPTLMIAPPWAVDPATVAGSKYTGALYNGTGGNPDAETAWVNYVKKAAQAFMQQYPNRQQDIYQITWEPITDWGYKGTPEQLIRIYQLAYGAIHSVDPKAVVAGPTMFIHGEGVWDFHWGPEQQSVTLFQKGLGQYLDAYTTHPYYEIRNSNNPSNPAHGTNAAEMASRIRYVVSQADSYSGKTLPLYGTEQGYADDGTLAGELNVARGLIQQNLIMMGEGFKFNFGFYATDYNDGAIQRYGYFYNLINSMPYGPSKVSPKIMAAAYAAQSYVLEGHKTAGAYDTLGGTQWGYKYQRPVDSHGVMAFWDYGETTSTRSVFTGLDSVQVYDWMGNSQWMTTNNGYLTLTLGQEPLYLITPPAWAKDSNGTWSNGDNWTVLAANSAGAEAHFTQAINAARTITVDTPVTVGSIQFRNANSYTLAGSNTITMDTITGDAAISIDQGRHTIAAPMMLKRNLQVNANDASGGLAISGSIGQNGTQAVIKNGAGALTLSGNNTYSGGTTLNGGILNLGSSGALGTGGTFVINGGAIDNTSGASLTLNSGGTNHILLNNNLNYIGSNNLTIAGSTYSPVYLDLGGVNRTINVRAGMLTLQAPVISNGGLTKEGAGTLRYFPNYGSSASTYTGPTTVNAGTLELDVGAAAGPLISSSSPLVMGGGTLQLAGGGGINSGSQTFNGTTIFAGASTLAIANDYGSNRVLNLGTLSRYLGATVNLAEPTGTISASNGYTTSTVSGSDVLGGWITVNGADWATNNGTNIVAYSGYTNDTWAYNANTTVTANSAPVANARTNTLRFNNNGAYTVTLSGTGNMISSGGILVTPNVGAHTSTITGGSLTGIGWGGDLIVIQNNTAGSLVIGSSIVDNNNLPSSLTKSGNGTLILTGSNTYTGGTTINQGSLYVNGSAPGAVTLRAGTLGGSGSVGNVTAQTGIISPGNGSGSTGILSTGNLTLSSATTLQMDVAGLTAGAQYDQLHVTGTVNLADANLSLLLQFAPSHANVLTLIDNDGVDPIIGTLAGLGQDATYSTYFNGTLYNFRVSYIGGTGNDLTLTNMPEPASLLLLATGAALFMTKRPQRRPSEEAKSGRPSL